VRKSTNPDNFLMNFVQLWPTEERPLHKEDFEMASSLSIPGLDGNGEGVSESPITGSRAITGDHGDPKADY
jgi:hypothetical protein